MLAHTNLFDMMENITVHATHSIYHSTLNVSAAKNKMQFTKYVFIHESAFKYVVARVEDDILSAYCSVTMLACLQLQYMSLVQNHF